MAAASRRWLRFARLRGPICRLRRGYIALIMYSRELLFGVESSKANILHRWQWQWVGSNASSAPPGIQTTCNLEACQ